jgi:hypothetical protein
MNYTKPQASALGDAVIVIEQLGYKPPAAAIDPSHNHSFFNPAYDLDE